ncbi:hypothetical protein JR316_0007931 [Psilocybe cubensis]|uniref:Uncharacterized protein n=2 Tax=Psilocybe cubensis TaxID=181762 RepID=A0ACB8GUT9_PSICU|nr:hypothetical protein JR316_0007931 [Psilocybe cubensis]KAH9479341.1 hypothetical protein JR316_0007931 [Psilocybe cubensis]
MANYLPVLITSISANATPDDSALVTLPRGQVDYLSHEWQEEDVWRSWRNMTRQKNEITNGVRLENASWRTWWKQRNKLKTISPETLNWLKDSDVTWLYGPLHTAVEWTPPPKPTPVPDTVDAANPASAHDRLDLSSSSASRRAPRPAPYKPILKHRSISELLTSDLPPTSPIFSPVESEDEQSDTTKQNTQANRTDPTTLVSHSQFSSKLAGKRPTLTHTKSDTHITRWGPSRAFRKDSPPRIDPPGFDSSQAHGYFPPVSSSSNSPSSLSQPSTNGSIRASLSQDSNSSESGGNGGGVTSSGGDTRGGHHSHSHGTTTHKKKHISFNTFVEQCIAIEKPKKNASGYFGASAGAQIGWPAGRVNYADDDGYDEDEEDSEDEEDEIYAAGGSQWHTPRQSGARAVRNDSDSPIEEEDDDDEEDDGIIEMRSSSSSYRARTPKPTPKKFPRSQSKVSTASSSSSTSNSSYGSGSNSNSTLDTTNSSPSGSLSPSRRTPSNNSYNRKSPNTSSSSTPNTNDIRTLNRRASNGSTSTYRPSSTRRGPPPLIRTTSDSHSHSHQQHRVNVTIAPIAPTILKTTGVWAENFGDDGASDDGFGFASGFPWTENRQHGYGRNGYHSDSGNYGSFGIGRGSSRGFYGGAEDETQESDGTPVELVYVPPLGSNYLLSLGVGDESPEYDHHHVQYGGFRGGKRGGYFEEDEDSGHVEQVEDVNAVYHHPPNAGMASVGFSVGGPSSSQRPVNGATAGAGSAPIPIHHSHSSSALNAHAHGGVPNVVVNPGGPLSSSVPNIVYRGARAIPRQQPEVEEEDAYDFFEGPDLGEDYYYARRGGRGYERERESDKAYAAAAAAAASTKSPTLTVPSNAGYGSSKSERDRDRGSDRRHSRSHHGSGFGGGGAGEERQSRSRSRSQSRTPSPAFTVSPTVGGTATPAPAPASASSSSSNPLLGVGTGVVVVGRRRSSSASSPSGPNTWITGGGAPASNSAEQRLSPPARGRQQDLASSTTNRSSATSGQPARGRSSTRTSSSSSWERERGSSAAGSLTGSPIGSLSPGPDGLGRAGSGVGIGAVLGGAAVLAGGGRADREREREKDKDRERERGRERRGRDRTSGKVLTASETESMASGSGSLGRDDTASVDSSSVSASFTGSVSGVGTESGSSGSRTVAPTAHMESSFYSTTSSSSSSTNTSNSTIMAAPATVVPSPSPAGDDEGVDVEMQFFRRAEEEMRRRSVPTPSNSPVVEMRRMAPNGVGDPPKSASTSTSNSNSSGGTTPTGATTPSPPLSTSNAEAPLFAPVPSTAAALAMKRAGSPGLNYGRSSASPVGGISASQPLSASVGSNSNPNSPSNKLRPPPLIPPPAGVAKPSTSFTAVSSPRSAGAVAGLSSPASASAVVSAPVSAPTAAAVARARSPPVSEKESSGTIVGKAVDMVSSAGAFLGWWSRDTTTATEGQ